MIDDETIACMIDGKEMIRVNIIIENNAVMLNAVLHVPHDYEHMDGFMQDCVMMHDTDDAVNACMDTLQSWENKVLMAFNQDE